MLLKVGLYGSEFIIIVIDYVLHKHVYCSNTLVDHVHCLKGDGVNDTGSIELEEFVTS